MNKSTMALQCEVWSVEHAACVFTVLLGLLPIAALVLGVLIRPAYSR